MRCLPLSLVLVGSVGMAAFAEGDAKDPPVRVLVPAYFYPAGEGLATWDRLIAAADQAPITAIVNPASGPGEKADPNYVRVLARAKESKLTLIGYVSTSYAQRDLKDVKADIDRWMTLYPGLHGFFFDEQTSGAKEAGYYAELARHARKRLPKGLLVANPGTVCDEAYYRQKTADVWCLSEGSDPIADYKPPAWAAKYPRDRFCILLYGLRDGDRMKENVEAMIATRAGYVFVTDDVLPNPWDTLPPYFEDMVRVVGARK